MKIPSWAFGILRIGIIGLLYVTFSPRYSTFYGQPLFYYGLPFFMLLGILGLHRYWMFALGTFLLCTSIAQAAPPINLINPFLVFMLGMVSFFLGFTPCDREYSVRSWYRRDRPEFFEFQAAPQLTWNLYRLMVSFLYMRFVLISTNGGYFEGNFIMRNFANGNLDSDFLYASWFPLLCAAAAVLLYAINVGLTVAVWFPRAYRALVFGGVLFHLGHLTLSQGLYLSHFLFLLLLIPFAAVQRLDKPLTIHQQIPVSF